jgi:O-antigen ligase
LFSSLTPGRLIAVAASAAPSLLAYNLSPSPTFLNQALALALWGGFVLLSQPSGAGHRPMALWSALALVTAGAASSLILGALPSSFALSAFGLLVAAAVLAAGGGGARSGRHATAWFVAFCIAWLVAGLLNLAVGAVQVFAPAWADGNFIATPTAPGRASGNLRQPNHLSSLLLWACIAVVALVELRQLQRRAAVVLLALLIFGVVLTASRTGLVGVLVLAAWGALDQRMAGRTRLVLLAMPLAYALAWLGMAEWAELSEHTFGGAARLAEGDISSSRFAIWANTLELIRLHPWAGVGFGEFNLAWTLTPFPGRPTAFFDHTHNLPLQLAVELGLPLATLVMALLLWGLWQAARAAWMRDDEPGAAQRAAFVFVLMIGLHSLLEYPLWYSYFLLPAAWAWGFALGGGEAAAAPATRAPSRWLQAGGVLVVVGAVASVFDYLRVAAIFEAGPQSAPLAQRIEAGRRSVLFGHHADYAAVTGSTAPREPERSFATTTHYLLDTRLMIAWAEHFARRGELDKARHIAARLAEFDKEDAEAFFAPCGGPPIPGPAASAVSPATAATAAAAASSASAPALPFQCQAPGRELSWRDFLAR